MAIKRNFLNRQQQPLAAAADFLLERYRQDDTIQLKDVVLVLPGRRAGRRLLEILLERAEAENLAFVPPHIATAGAVPELLYEPKRPFASDIVQRLAWARALKETDRKLVEQVFPQLPTDDASSQWMFLASLLWRFHRELAADALDFQDVAKRGSGLSGFAEQTRWQNLRRIQETYLGILDELALWDMQTARLYAIEREECHTEKDIVLIATVDMNRALRHMLEQVADKVSGNVTALVYAPESWAERFDELGCLVPAAWQDVVLDVADEQILTADSAAEQAELVLRSIAEYEGRYSADEITIGVPDEGLVPHIQRELSEHDIPVRWLVGNTLPETGPYKLLDAIREYLALGRVEGWANLVRHPDVSIWLAQQGIPGHWLTQLDEYHNQHLQPRLDGRWLGRKKDRMHVESAHAQTASLLEEVSGTQRRNLDEWTAPLLDVLSQVYGHRVLDRTDPAAELTIGACGRLNACLASQATLPPRIVPPVTAAEAIDMLLEQLSGEDLPSPADPEAIEILGWLELPLDDAPALLVTSFNEGHVPTSINGDLFLPDRLRQRLGLDDNLRRYARDAYALQALQHTREHLLLLVSRRDNDGNPLAPSRLLFAADGPTIARRVLALCQSPGQSESRPLQGGRFHATREQSRFDVPPPVSLDNPIDSLRVTAFRSYISCPYRFYLEHVLGLGTIDDSAEELDALAFGSLIHEVLNAFGESKFKHSTDPTEIQRFLVQSLEKLARQLYGSDMLAPVSVQIRQLEARLAAFAQWQADWARAGWRIAHSEVPPRGSPGVPFDVDGEPLLLRGRIDRIDTNDDGQWVVFDYKSSTTPTKPERAHQTSGEWVDLQLPLYRHIAASLGVTGDVRFGYIVLPKDTTKVGELIAEWASADLESADEEARNVVRRIRRQEFWPPSATPDFAEDFAPICMDDVFEPPRYLTDTGAAKKVTR